MTQICSSSLHRNKPISNYWKDTKKFSCTFSSKPIHTAEATTCSYPPEPTWAQLTGCPSWSFLAWLRKATWGSNLSPEPPQRKATWLRFPQSRSESYPSLTQPSVYKCFYCKTQWLLSWTISVGRYSYPISWPFWLKAHLYYRKIKKKVYSFFRCCSSWMVYL